MSRLQRIERLIEKVDERLERTQRELEAFKMVEEIVGFEKMIDLTDAELKKINELFDLFDRRDALWDMRDAIKSEMKTGA